MDVKKIVSICEGSPTHYGVPHTVFWKFLLMLWASDQWANTYEKSRNLGDSYKGFVNAEMCVKIMVWVYVNVPQLIMEVLIKFCYNFFLDAPPDLWIHTKKFEKFGQFLKNGLLNMEMSVKKWCEYTWRFPNSLRRSSKRIFQKKNMRTSVMSLGTFTYTHTIFSRSFSHLKDLLGII